MTNLMIDVKNPSLKNILSIIELMEETGLEFYRNLKSLAHSDCQLLFNDLSAGASALLQCKEQVKNDLKHSCYSEMVENIYFTLGKTVDLINAGQEEKAATVMFYQFIPFIQELFEEVYFWGAVYPDKDAMEIYYNHEFIPHHANSLFNKNNPKYQLSIFIPVYNKLEYTKHCLDSIFSNTDLSLYSYELILINDGSTDGTQEYFDNLNIEKVIELKKNVKTSIFTLAYRICEGEYFLFINNDTIVTEGWLDNLMTCIKSNPNIISATPCTPNTSNYQCDLDGRYLFNSLKEVMAHRNVSDPLLWEERARIMPVIALYRTEYINQIGFADRLFYTMEFWDDDFSLRARRAGFIQTLCKDTYCHHFGSVTGKDSQIKENTLQNGRQLFLFKNGIDAWGRDFCYDYQTISFIKSSVFPSDSMPPNSGSKSMNAATIRQTNDKLSTYDASILGIDCGFGDTLLQLKSWLNHHERNASICTINTQNTFMDDLNHISSPCIRTDFILNTLQSFDDFSFDYILVQEPLEYYSDFYIFLEELHSKLKQGGFLIFQASNIYYKSFLEKLLNFSFPSDSELVRFLNIPALQKRLETIFTKTDCIAQAESLEDADAFKNAYMPNCTNPLAIPLLTAKILNFYCQK